jgi:hypothetical protein
MKPNKYYILLTFVFFLMQLNKSIAQDPATAEEVVKLNYFNNNNSVQYLILESMLKNGKVLTPQKGKVYELYLDSSSAELFIGKVQIEERGKVKVFIPATLKTAWDASGKHKFIVKSGETEVLSDYAITKSKITLDTASAEGTKTITVSVMKWEDNKWAPVKDVEMKVGISRLSGSILSAGDAETFTTDSTGTVAVEFKKDKIPGDINGFFSLVARVENNDELGNLLVEKSVKWGVPKKIDNTFFNLRTLWSARFRAPYWLMFMAYSIIIGVWGTLIFLVIQLIKIKKLGTG